MSTKFSHIFNTLDWKMNNFSLNKKKGTYDHSKRRNCS